MAVNILVVDDDHDDLELFGEALVTTSPHAVFNVAVNGQDAIHFLNTSSVPLPALILLDINMPIMNGWDCISFLKSSRDFSDIPVLMYSTSSTHADKEKAKRMGAICFVSKMQDFRSLKKLVRVVVENLEKNAPDKICTELKKLQAN